LVLERDEQPLQGSEREPCLCFDPGHAQHEKVCRLGDHIVDQCALADPRVALQKDDATQALTQVRDQAIQLSALIGPALEGHTEHLSPRIE
jgi:hypothetical protein